MGLRLWSKPGLFTLRDRANRSSGHSLLELLIAMAMLGGLMAIIFMAFGMSTKIFSESTVRLSTEQQLKTIHLVLKRDIELTDFWFANTAGRFKDSQPRDGLCVVGLSEWNDPALIQAGNQHFAWDRYAVWYATQESPGKLIRQTLAPPPINPSTYLDAPYALLGSNLSDTDPASNKFALSTRYFSNDVTEFEATTRLQNGTISVKLGLLRHGVFRAHSLSKVEDHLEALWTFHPRNSWPEI